MSERYYTAYTRICHCTECAFFVEPVHDMYSAIRASKISHSRCCPDCGASLTAGIGRFSGPANKRSLLGFKWTSEGPIDGYELREEKEPA